MRIYRRYENEPEHLTGVVEWVEKGTTVAFNTIEELGKILSGAGLASRKARVAKEARRRIE